MPMDTLLTKPSVLCVSDQTMLCTFTKSVLDYFNIRISSLEGFKS